jgi:hypothetical protein
VFGDYRGLHSSVLPHVQEFQEAPIEQVGSLVRGGLWEVDLLLRLMSPCYWPEVRDPR